MERRRMVQLFEAAEHLWGSFDDFPALPPGIDPMPHLSRNTISQPFFLVSDQDQTLINLSGEGAVWFEGERPEQLQLVVGDSVYIPAGIPSQVITHTPSVQVRFKAETAGKEAVVWYCPDCRAVVHWRSIDTQAEIPQAAYWQAVQQFNTDSALRVCPACQSEQPRAELGDIAWPAVAQAIQSTMDKAEGEEG